MGSQRVGHDWVTELNFVCLLVFLLMGKAEWGGNPVCWWLGLYFCFICCLDDESLRGCYWWLGDAGSCIQVGSFVCILTIWYSVGLILWYSRVMESVLPLQRLRVWSPTCVLLFSSRWLSNKESTWEGCCTGLTLSSRKALGTVASAPVAPPSAPASAPAQH